MYFIDTHCHLDLIKGIEKDPLAEDSSIIKTISVTNAPIFYEPNNQLFANSKNIRVALGMHPELVVKYHGQLDIFAQYISSTKYIGEIGLDGSPSQRDTFDLQIQVFKNILSIVSNEDSKILTIHSRNAAQETIALLSKYLAKSRCKVILHWYSGSIRDMKAAIDDGFYFSINHKMASSAKGQEIIRNIPDLLLLTETDAPFTFSSTIRTRIESLNSTIKTVAYQRHKSIEDVKLLFYRNFETLVKL